MDTLLAENSLALFKTAYFVMSLFILGAIYIYNFDSLKGTAEHVLIIFSILLFSAGLAITTGMLKVNYDMAHHISGAGGINEFQARNLFYSGYAASLNGSIESIRYNNRILEVEVNELDMNISNRTPIIVEAIITVPPEIIYVDEPVVTNREPEDSYEKEDD
jgi:hypothetical protein